MDRKRLLVIDDEQDMLDSVAEVLGERFELTLVCDGFDALAVLQQAEFDGVLLDLKMPGVDGFDVLGYLKAFQPSTRVLIASGMPSLDRIAERYGAADWIAKPYHLVALEESITRLLGQEPGTL